MRQTGERHRQRAMLRRRERKSRGVLIAVVAVVVVAGAVAAWLLPANTRTKSLASGAVLQVRYSLLGRPIDASMLSGDLLLTGPLSSSGVQHGEWTGYNGKSGQSSSLWFWYGEPVSEGDWHKNNGR